MYYYKMTVLLLVLLLVLNICWARADVYKQKRCHSEARESCELIIRDCKDTLTRQRAKYIAEYLKSLED